jgi:hypothetical protein
MLHMVLFLSCCVSADNFAKLFRPKAALWNKVLEVTIDDISYVSFPTPCGEERDREASSSSQGLGSSGTSEQASGGSGSYPSGDLITLFNVVIAIVRESALRRVLGSSYDGFDGAMRAAGITNVTDLRRVGCDPLTAAMGLRDGIHPIACSVVRR